MKKISFKPYYKWITFNTYIGGWLDIETNSFKPYYKWITFNTNDFKKIIFRKYVLNLIINGLPSIHLILNHTKWKHLM